MNFYYHPNPEETSVLSTEESAHVVKVLRAKEGTHIALLDGLGHSYLVEVTDPNSRKCGFKILEKTHHTPKSYKVHVALAPTKSTDRLEWFVEKACELGVDAISILITQRTERSKVNLDRLEKKAIAAMKQSKNFWKCQISGPIKLRSFVSEHGDVAHKFAAYVETGQESLLQKKVKSNEDILILIGPEGDFSPEEIGLLQDSNYELVSLGSNVLRTETAGIIAVHTVNLINQSL